MPGTVLYFSRKDLEDYVIIEVSEMRGKEVTWFA